MPRSIFFKLRQLGSAVLHRDIQITQRNTLERPTKFLDRIRRSQQKAFSASGMNELASMRRPLVLGNVLQCIQKRQNALTIHLKFQILLTE